MNRVWVAVGLLVVWMGVTFLLIPAQDGDVALDMLVTQGVGRQFVIACLVLIVAAVVLRWGDMGFGPPQPTRSVLLGWMHVAAITGFLVLAVTAGLPSGMVITFLLVNTLLVGFSEEVMFRGFVLSAFRGVMGVWPAVLLSSVIFGGVHVLNGFITGAWGPAVFQAVMATLSGIGFAALRVRTGSLWPGIVLHGLWDAGLFLMTQSMAPESALAGNVMVALMPVLLVLVITVYALWLLRGQSWRRA